MKLTEVYDGFQPHAERGIQTAKPRYTRLKGTFFSHKTLYNIHKQTHTYISSQFNSSKAEAEILLLVFISNIGKIYLWMDWMDCNKAFRKWSMEVHPKDIDFAVTSIQDGHQMLH